MGCGFTAFCMHRPNRSRWEREGLENTFFFSEDDTCAWQKIIQYMDALDKALYPLLSRDSLQASRLSSSVFACDTWCLIPPFPYAAISRLFPLPTCISPHKPLNCHLSLPQARTNHSCFPQHHPIYCAHAFIFHKLVATLFYTTLKLWLVRLFIWWEGNWGGDGVICHSLLGRQKSVLDLIFQDSWDQLLNLMVICRCLRRGTCFYNVWFLPSPSDILTAPSLKDIFHSSPSTWEQGGGVFLLLWKDLLATFCLFVCCLVVPSLWFLALGYIS